MSEKKKGLELLREPFPVNQVSKLPKGTKAQNECQASEKVNCKVCGGFHHPKVIHLDYVGHAALTDRLLDADPLWTWEPFALKDGLPAFDNSGGLWIKLTVCGHTRTGYGHAATTSFKDIGAREKEVIGDALRNAAMRFGAALDLWHKGDLHIGDDEGHKEATKEITGNPDKGKASEAPPQKDEIPEFSTENRPLTFDELREKILATTALPHLKNIWVKYKSDIEMLPEDEKKRLTAVKDAKKKELQGGANE